MTNLNPVTVKCIKCEKDIVCDGTMNGEIIGPDRAGYVTVEFGWASQLDHYPLQTIPEEKIDTEAEKELSKCDVVKGFLCDDCFVNNHKLFQLYKVVQGHKEYTRVGE